MSLPHFNEMASVEDTLIFFFKIFSIEFFFFLTVVIKGILLADVGGVNELRWLLNCVSHDPLHEREREIHCSAPASLTFPFSHRA